MPSYQDMLHVRARTTGIVETFFMVEESRSKARLKVHLPARTAARRVSLTSTARS